MSAIDFRILDRNFTQVSNVNISATSEDASFPASNVGKPHRTDVWRSAGYFEITASNNKLDFKETSGGSEVTATIPVGNYSVSLLEETIKLAMDSISGVGATYTVSYDADTGLWSIATDLAFLSLLWNTGTNTANSIGAILGFGTDADDTGSTSYTAPAIALHTVERFILDIVSTNEPIDSVALVFPPSGHKLTDQATITLKGNHSNSWSSPAVSQSLTIDEEVGVATHFFTTDQAYRYWCIEISDPENPNLYVELSKVIIAKATNLGKAPSVGFVYSVSDRTKEDATDYGQRYHDILPNFQRLSFNFSLLTFDQFETLVNIYNRVGTVLPIAMAFDTTEALYDAQRFFIYGNLRGNLAPVHRFTSYFDQQLELEESF